MDHAKHLHMNIICQNLAIAHSAGIHCFFFLFDAIFKPTGVIQKQHSLCAGVNYRTWTVYCTKLFATVWQWFLFLSDSIWPVVPLCIWLSLFLYHNSLPWLIKSNLSLTTCNNTWNNSKWPRNELENHFMCLNSLEEVTSRVYFQFFQSTDIKNKSTTWQYKLNFTSSLYLLKYFKYLCRTPKHTTKVFLRNCCPYLNSAFILCCPV